jgi:hypothetical protein
MDLHIIERMRQELKPKGTAPLVILRPLGIGIEMHADFVSKCIDELERIQLLGMVGEEPSNLEKLAFQLLLDSAYIDPKAERERAERLAEYAREVE